MTGFAEIANLFRVASTATTRADQLLLLHRSNININDVLGDYSLSLIESLGTLAVSNF